MVDTARTLAEVKALLADNTSHAISPQDVRDLVESIANPVVGGGFPYELTDFTDYYSCWAYNQTLPILNNTTTYLPLHAADAPIPGNFDVIDAHDYRSPLGAGTGAWYTWGQGRFWNLPVPSVWVAHTYIVWSLSDGVSGGTVQLANAFPGPIAEEWDGYQGPYGAPTYNGPGFNWKAASGTTWEQMEVAATIPFYAGPPYTELGSPWVRQDSGSTRQLRTWGVDLYRVG